MEIVFLSKFFNKIIDDEVDIKVYNIKNPKKVESELVKINEESKIYNIIVEGKIISQFERKLYIPENNPMKKYYEILNNMHPRIFYVNDETFLIRYRESDIDSENINEFNLYSMDIIWNKVQNEHDCFNVLFVNEKEIYFTAEFDYGPAHSCTGIYENYYNFDSGENSETRIDKRLNNRYFPFISDERNDYNYFIYKEILDFELNKRYGLSIQDYDYVKNYVPQDKNDEMVKINLTNETIEYPKYKLKKYNSEIINNQLKNAEEIFLPLSRFDSSIECLDYLRAKYLDIKLIKQLIRDLKNI